MLNHRCSRITVYEVVVRCVLFWAIAGQCKSATPAALAATLASATVPPGGTAQLQIFLTTAETLVSGGVVITLDSTVFDNITAADVYSATGDQVGTANIQGRTVDIEFDSPTGGIGRIPGLPVLTITVPVLSTATPGAVSTPAFKTGTLPWADSQGVAYAMTFGGSLLVGGSLSVQSVQPLGSLLPAGTVVTIAGTGFSSSTTVQIDGSSLSATQFVSAQQINVTLAAPVDLEFHRVTLQNGNASVAFFPALHGNYIGQPTTGALATIQPILPLQLYSAATVGTFANYPEGAELAIQNPSQSPVDVTIVTDGPDNPGAQQTSVTIAPGGTYVQRADAGHFTTTYVVPTAPIRLATVVPVMYPSYGSSNLVSAYTVPPTQLSVVVNGAGSPSNPIVLNMNLGGAQPAPIILAATSSLPATFTVSASTVSGGPWLSVTPQQGAACVGFFFSHSVTCPPPSLVTASVNPANLVPGVYNGSLTFVPQGSNAPPYIVPVVLNIYAKPEIFTVQSGAIYYYAPAPGASTQPPFSETIRITSTADPVAFTTSAATQSGQNWLSVTPSQGQTPATVTVTVTPAAVSNATETGTINITGPGNTLTISALPEQPDMVPVYPTSLQFTAFLGQTPPAAQMVSVQWSQYTSSVQTASGGNWLSAVNTTGTPTGLTVSVSPASLAAGTYQGVITVSTTDVLLPSKIPVTLIVGAGAPPAVTVSPAALSLTVAHGAALNQTLNVSTGTLPLLLGVSYSTTDGAGWLGAYLTLPADKFVQPPAMTPDTVNVSVNTVGFPALDLLPGTYTGSITITAPTGSTNSATVPVSVTVTPANPAPPAGTIPIITAVLNGASQAPGALAPGEIVTIFGQNFGPTVPAGLQVASPSQVSTANSAVQVFFNNTAAPLLYVSSTQINAVVPYEVNGPTVSLVIQYKGASIAAGSYPVSSASPAIFTQNSTGEGAAAVLNQDSTLNSAANPAARGSIVQIYATGAGQTQPSSVTGSITASPDSKPALPVSLTIGGAAATVTYAGEAPGEVSGVLQVNAVVPAGVAAGSAVPIILSVGGAQSQTNAVIAIK